MFWDMARTIRVRTVEGPPRWQRPFVCGMATCLLTVGGWMLGTAPTHAPPPTRQSVCFDTEPEGAQVYLGDRCIGQSGCPVTVPHSRAASFAIRFVLDGYAIREVHIPEYYFANRRRYPEAGMPPLALQPESTLAPVALWLHQPGSGWALAGFELGLLLACLLSGTSPPVQPASPPCISDGTAPTRAVPRGLEPA